jgi:aldehyde dehydrogenase (NAD+)
VTSAVSPGSGQHLQSYDLLIGGERVPSANGARFDSINPATGAPWASFADAGPDDVDAAVRAARTAFEPWSQRPGVERARLMRRLGEVILENGDRLAHVESTDNGKILGHAKGHVQALAEWLEYFAGTADKIHGDTIPIAKTNFFLYTRREPLGVVAAITPWNSPLLILMWKLAPVLAAGCTMVVKPSEHASASTLELAALFEQAGIPAGVINVVTGDGPRCGRPLAQHPGVDKVAFTGSTATGASVMRDAADHIAGVQLELGGKSPNIVFEDVDIDEATTGIVDGIFSGSGQSCYAGSRLFVQEGVRDEIVSSVCKRAKSIKIGDPTDSHTEMGPVAFKAHLDRITGYVRGAVAEGATLVTGGGELRSEDLDEGFFMEPTVLTDVRNDMRVAREEIFGPVLSVIAFADEEEAIRLANDTRFGLAAGVWTNDLRRAHRVAHALRAGMVWVNSYRQVSVAAPFGGYKMSGLGRESGVEAVREYLETKTVWVELAGGPNDPAGSDRG